MRISTISIKFLHIGRSSKEFTFVADKSGVHMQQVGKDNQILIERKEDISEIFGCFVEMYQPKAFVVSVVDIQGLEYMDQEVFSLDDLFEMRKDEYAFEEKLAGEITSVEEPDWMWSQDMVKNWLIHSVLNEPFDNLFKTCIYDAKLEAIKDKECPVLLTPLTGSCFKLKKCGHYISREAWGKMVYMREGINEKACPLCRAPHRAIDIE